jgi:murein DD-endopeptidase MepM/ murein hydrolase activator NlpD
VLPQESDLSLPDIAPAGTGAGTGGPTASAASTGEAAAAAGGRVRGFKRGDPVIGGTSVGGEHETMGLPGYPAHDYFAKAGSTAVAPVSGKVVKLSGHDPKNGPTQGPHGPLGWSVYIQGTDGKTYFLTHMGSRTVKVGQKVTAGAKIGTVANYDKYGTPSHIHMGVSG